MSLPSQPWFTLSGVRASFPFYDVLGLSRSAADVIFTFLTPPPPPSSLPPSTSTGSCCNVSPSSSQAPPRPAHQAPAGLLFVSQAAQGQQGCVQVMLRLPDARVGSTSISLP